MNVFASTVLWGLVFVLIGQSASAAFNCPNGKERQNKTEQAEATANEPEKPASSGDMTPLEPDNADERPYLPFAGTTARENPVNSSSLWSAELTTALSATTKDIVPFWMRSRQFGSIPESGLSASMLFAGHKYLQQGSQKPLVDWGVGFEGRLNAGKAVQFQLIEAYLQGRWGKLGLKAGRSKEIVGLIDTTLSSGSWSISGNALGIPKVEIGFNDYWNVPLTKGIIALKWNFAHGWLGTLPLYDNAENMTAVDKAKTYFHQKSLYGRLGRPDWKVRLYGGINHEVTWGSENKIYRNFGLSDFEKLRYIFLGKAYETDGVPGSKIGNHLGSIDQAAEYDSKNILFTGYHQFFYDAGALAKLANVSDGIFGISLKNKQEARGFFHWSKFLFEYLHSKSQGGELGSKVRASGFEDYYNNFLYLYGWSYLGENLGNPLFTSRKYIRSDLPDAGVGYQYFTNNRIIAFHGGALFQLGEWSCKGLLTYSLNYGNYSTSPAARGLGEEILYFDPPYFGTKKQVSSYLETQRMLKNGFLLGIRLALDKGEVLPDSFGGEVSICKRW